MRFTLKEVEAGARFDVFYEEERERQFKALYFVTGNKADAEELTQDAFLKLWERWGEIDRIEDPTAYLFHRQAVNSSSRSVEDVASIPKNGNRRWRNHARSGPSGSTASSLVWATSGGSDSRIPAWAFTISPSAQNVMPSP